MRFHFPVKQRPRITTRHGDRIWYGTHKGVDIASDDPGSVYTYSPSDGKIRNTRHYQGGNVIKVLFPGGYHWMAHHEHFLLADNSLVKAGAVIGIMGATPGYQWARGRHLHWHTVLDGHVVDPMVYLKEEHMSFTDRILKELKRKFRDPQTAFVYTGENEYLVKGGVKRRIVSQANTKDIEALKNVFGVYREQEDMDRVPSGPDL